MARRFSIYAWFMNALCGLLLLCPPLLAQDNAAAEEGTKQPPAQPAEEAPKPPAKDPGAEAVPTTPKPDKAEAEAAFQAKFGEWKGLLVHLRELRSKYHDADDATRPELEQDWNATVAQAEQMMPDLVQTVLNAYVAAPGEDRVKTSFLVKVLSDYVDHDQYEPALALGRALLDNQCDEPDVYRDTGIAAYAMNDYDLTEQLLSKAEAEGETTADAAALRAELENYKTYWKEEQETRAKEAAADDLPRVKLTTSKGDIVVELFENEAPETVANFISLVKSGFYDGLTFHRVISQFMAQAGCPEGDGTGGPGYNIYDECDKPGARKHFRGVLSMAKTAAANSGGSQFFINFRATPHLNGVHTVFGRVIEGMDVVTKLQRRKPQEENQPEPDTIIKAEVLRDRGHEYLPRKVE